MSTPNIYEYPENASPLELARYQVAVMEAAGRGELVEWFVPGQKWSPIPAEPNPWAWVNGFRYRIARPKIAAGHNPDKLTEAQVGVSEGWRLLTKEEVATCRQEQWPETQWYEDGGWSDTGEWFCSDPRSHCTLRTKQPPGYYLPSPAVQPRTESRREKIATIVQLIRNGNETADQVAERIDTLLGETGGAK